MSDNYRLENRKKHIRENTDLEQHEKQFLIQDYLDYLGRVGVQKDISKERNLRILESILTQTETTVREIEEMNQEQLLTLNEEIVEKIQDSFFKKKSGEYTVRSKNGYWLNWKRMLQELGYSTEPYEEHIPAPVKFSTDRSEVKNKKKVSPNDLPTPDQVRRFVKTVGELSENLQALRNKAFFLLAWSTGARAGELQEIQRKDITVTSSGQLYIFIEGNKRSKDRRNRIIQGRKTIKEWIEKHPSRDPESLLFPPLKEPHKNMYKSIDKQRLREKSHQARKHNNLEFKTENMPIHVFRHGMSTYSVVNDISWEKVCERQGKSPDSTMPIYVKMAMRDVDDAFAEMFGVEKSDDLDQENRMIAPGLLPRDCADCGKENRCYRETCSSCGAVLPEGTMPNNIETDKNKNVTNREIENLERKIEELKNRQ